MIVNILGTGTMTPHICILVCKKYCIRLPQGGSCVVCSCIVESHLTQFEKVLPGYFLAHGLFFTLANVYGHIMLKAPVLVRSLKLSNIELC